MDSRGTDKIADKIDDLSATETPEDVAVLYSWANLHGAKYRDFSASRREYRAQLRHRAAQQVREQALLAQAEAEAAAAAADSAARHASLAARTHQAEDADSSMRRALREAEDAARTAAAERVEAARRAEIAAVAEAAARREEREIAEAHASAQRQAARYADSEIRRRAAAGTEYTSPALPGRTSAPHTGHPISQMATSSHLAGLPEKESKQIGSTDQARSTENQDRREYSASVSEPMERRATAHQPMNTRRPRGYRPDDASGVRQIYRGPDDSTQAEYTTSDPTRQFILRQNPALPVPLTPQDMKTTPEQLVPLPHTSSNPDEGNPPLMGQRRTDPQPHAASSPSQAETVSTQAGASFGTWPPTSGDYPRSSTDSNRDSIRESPVSVSSPRPPAPRQSGISRSVPLSPSTSTRPVSPFSQALVPSDSTRGRRAQDDFDYQQSTSLPESPRRNTLEHAPEAAPAGPAWLYAPPVPPVQPKPIVSSTPPTQSSVADTLQHSRERVAARWFALKGVFEQPGQELPEATPVRQKETRTPVLAVFSLAGGVGKTSLVATVGRALSSMGEKVLLTDTTSHGLLPFYFGASELRQGTVRTFSPPSGSTDAPIYLVSYEVDQKASDESAQELLAEEIINNGRGAHRILLDLTVGSSWIVRRMSRMNPTILVPVAPDMNSVISLQTVEKFFSGVNDGDGRPLQPFYVLNQFDTSLPLHLDVREVMRRQLGDRLLPFVIRRAPAVSEALAEGMTVVDYAPDAPVAEDYLNLAAWLRTVAAPATAGFRNVRWSER
jgi:cellulose synthase operon protein YhjQ